MKVVTISLYNAKKRTNFINSQLNKQGIRHTIFRGLDNNQFQLKDKNHGKGLIGCYISHLLAWQNHANEGDYTIFLEDDYVLPDNFLSITEEYIKDLPEDNDISFLYWSKLGKSSYAKKSINKTWNKSKGVWSTAALIVNNKSIQKLTNVLDKVYGHIDIILYEKGWNNELNVYYLNNPVGGLGGLKSQIY